MKHVKKHVKYLKSMTKRWYCILLKILTYLLSARFWLCLWLCLWLWRCRCCCRFAVRSFVCLLCNAAMRLVGGSAREGGSSKNCMRQRAASNSYDYHNLYGLGDLRQAAAAAALGRARNQNQNKSKGKRNRKQKEQQQKPQQENREEIFCVAGDVFRAASCFSNACGAHGAAHLTNAKYVDLGTARHLRVLKIIYIHIYREREWDLTGQRGKGGPLNWKSVE